MIREEILNTRFGETAGMLRTRAARLIRKYPADKYPDAEPRDEFDEAIRSIFKLMGNCHSSSQFERLKTDVCSVIQGISMLEYYDPDPHVAWLVSNHPSIDSFNWSGEILYAIWRARDTSFPDRLKLT